jgi:hypothetical protein
MDFCLRMDAIEQGLRVVNVHDDLTRRTRTRPASRCRCLLPASRSLHLSLWRNAAGPGRRRAMSVSVSPGRSTQTPTAANSAA